VLDQAPSGDGGSDADPAQPDRPGVTAAKGRPTPKRSEVERRRRQPYTAPADRKAASTQSRDASRTARQRRTAAMRNGEEWALPPKDKGPVRALARDVVDSRRGISEFVDYIVLAILVVIIGEGWYVGRRVLRLAQQRFPGESMRGVRLYAAMRGTQTRRMRMPAPRVKPGAKV
jgi:hypothetical protein